MEARSLFYMSPMIRRTTGVATVVLEAQVDGIRVHGDLTLFVQFTMFSGSNAKLSILMKSVLSIALSFLV